MDGNHFFSWLQCNIHAIFSEWMWLVLGFEEALVRIESLQIKHCGHFGQHVPKWDRQNWLTWPLLQAVVCEWAERLILGVRPQIYKRKPQICKCKEPGSPRRSLNPPIMVKLKLPALLYGILMEVQCRPKMSSLTIGLVVKVMVRAGFMMYGRWN